MYLFYFTGR